MSGRSFSLRGLLIGVAVVAVALAVWLSSNAWLASAVFSLALLVPALAAIAAIACQGELRCRWLGCAILSAGYLWAITAPSAHPMVSTVWMIQQEGPLLTSKLNEWLYMNVFIKLRPPPALPAGMGMGMGMGGMFGGMGGGMPGMGTFVVTTGTPGSLSTGAPTASATATAVSPPVSYPSLEDFARVGHAYFALFFGWAGSALAGFLVRRGRVDLS